MAKMNVKRLERLAELVENTKHAPTPKDDGFNMSWWVLPTTCGTICCIGGTAAKFMLKRSAGETEVGKYLGLSVEVAFDLFYPYAVHTDRWRDITPKMAARVIRNLITTGKVKWPRLRSKSA